MCPKILIIQYPIGIKITTTRSVREKSPYTIYCTIFYRKNKKVNRRIYSVIYSSSSIIIYTFIIPNTVCNTTNKVNRKILVNVLVNAVYLYDDRITYVMNVGERTVEITEGLLADIRANSPLFFESSTIDELAPPYRNQSNSFVNAKEFRLIFLLKLNLYLHIIR